MAVLDLKSDEALTEIRRLRATRALDPLRKEMRAEFSEKRCLVVGSAPDAILPEPACFDACICVNGSPWLVREAKLGHPDMTIIAGWSTRTDNDVRVETQRIYRGLETHQLLFIESGATVTQGLQVLLSLRSVPLDQPDRARRHHRRCLRARTRVGASG